MPKGEEKKRPTVCRSCDGRGYVIIRAGFAGNRKHICPTCKGAGVIEPKEEGRCHSSLN